ncbi:MAG TPA: M56 family metallopeptidase [Candidatus Dormibacteraeota bacterium]|nr:M56 family metallopeptidase [Candidatus Dormibacteraeota bacterium]
MISPFVETLAQAAVTRILNSLPEGIVLVLLAGIVLRVLPKQNSRTRFAVWFLALLAVTSLPFIGQFGEGKIEASGLAGSAFAIDLSAHWAVILSGLWLLAASVAVVRVAAGLWHLRTLRRGCTVVDVAELAPALQQTLVELRAASPSLVKRPVTIATSENIRVPAALGLWKPMIVLPAWTLREVPASDLSIVLRHEFAHLRRWDDWTNLVQKIARAVFFFHPAVWWIENRLTVEREMACDDAVVAEINNPTVYANCLVSLLEKGVAQRGWTMAQAMVHRAREASLRLAQILDRNRPAATQVSKPVLGLICGLAVLCVTAAPYAPQLVTFDRNVPVTKGSASQPEIAYAPSVADTTPRFSPGAAVVAATWHGDSAQPRKIRTSPTKPAKARTAVPRTTNQRQPDSTVASVPELPIVPWLDVNAIVGPEDAAPLQTLVFVQSAHYLESDSGVVWSVRVWRITVIKPQSKQAAAAPVAHST